MRNIQTTNGIVHTPGKPVTQQLDSIIAYTACGLTTWTSMDTKLRSRRGEVRGKFVAKPATCLACLGV